MKIFGFGVRRFVFWVFPSRCLCLLLCARLFAFSGALPPNPLDVYGFFVFVFPIFSPPFFCLFGGAPPNPLYVYGVFVFVFLGGCFFFFFRGRWLRPRCFLVPCFSPVYFRPACVFVAGSDECYVESLLFSV